MLFYICYFSCTSLCTCCHKKNEWSCPSFEQEVGFSLLWPELTRTDIWSYGLIVYFSPCILLPYCSPHAEGCELSNNRLFDWAASLSCENISLSRVFGSYSHCNSNASLSLNCIWLSTRTTCYGWHLSPSCPQLNVYMICVMKIAFLIMLMTKNLAFEIWCVIHRGSS